MLTASGTCSTAATGPQRFSALLRGTEACPSGCSPAPCGCWSDGLVAREVRPTTPPQVTYSLTALGTGLAEALAGLTSWAVEHRDDVAGARAAYDAALDAALPPSG